MNRKTTCAVILSLAMATLSCSTAQIGAVGAGLAGAGTVIKIIGSVKVPPPPTATPAGTPTAPTPTTVPTTVPTAAPTRVPTQEPTATPTTAPTPAPCNAAPPAPDEPVSVLFVQRCPKGFERVDQYDASVRWAPAGTVICAARSTCDQDGHGACPGIGDRAAWAFGYNLNQGQVLQDFAGRTLIYDAGRGCKDAYGRFFHEAQGCERLYTNPSDSNAIWTYNAIAPALTCGTPTPGPTAAPTPAGHACTLPRGDGPGIDCPRTSSRLLGEVGAAIDRVLADQPTWQQEPGIIRIGFEDPFRLAVVGELQAAGLCATWDGEEIAVKNTNAFSEQYAILSTARNIRRGEGSYRATCTPAWSAIGPTTEATPTPAPTPTPEPVASSCSCLVGATVAFRGVNDNAAPALHEGDTADLDVTLRWACGAGDGRGQPCDKTCDGRPACGGRKCEPATDPVRWDIDCNGDAHVVLDGYGLKIRNLRPGTCTVRVEPTNGAINQEGEAVRRCPWSPGGSVHDSITFEVN